jgi:WD40 repeat protein
LPTHRWREIIEEPAKMAGLEVEAALIEKVIKDAETGDALPLLAVVLRTLYDKHIQNAHRGEAHSRALTLANYEALGDGVPNISPLGNTIRKVAETVLNVCGNRPAAEEALRETFVSGLVQLNDKGEFVRHRADWEAIPELGQSLITAFTQQRLIVTGEEGGRKFVEVSHEALLRTWPLLNGWLEEERDFLAGRRRIQEALKDWLRAEEHQKAATLLHGLLLDRAREWVSSHRAMLSAQEVEFLSESIAADEAARAQARRQQTKVFRITVGGLAVVTALAVAASYSAWQAMQQRDSALVTQSRHLSILSSQATQVGDTAKGMLLSIEALPGAEPSGKRPYTEEPELSLFQANAVNRQRAVLPHGDGAPVGLTVFSPDSSHVLTALGGDIISSESAPARLWDTRTGTQSVALEGAVSPTAQAGMTAEALADLRWTQKGYARHLTHAVFSRDGSRLLTVLWHTDVKLWDVSSGASTVSFAVHSERIRSATFSPDETYVVVESGDEVQSNFRIADSGTGVELEEINGADGLKRIAFSPDGARMVSQDQKNFLTLWNARARKPIAGLVGHQGAVNNVVFSPDGSMIATASSDKTARLWDAATGKALTVFEGHQGPLSRVSFSPSADQLLTASADKTVRLWALKPLKPSAAMTFEGHEGAILGADFNADGSRIITRSADKTSRLWDTQNGASLAVFQVEKSSEASSTASVTALFSPNGLRVVSWSEGSSNPETPVRLWNAETGQKLAEFAGADHGASFSLDGTRLLTSSRTAGTHLWDAADGKHLAVFGRPGERVDRASLSPDGSLAITVSKDTATLWDARTGASFNSRFAETLAPNRDRSGFEAWSPNGSLRVQRDYGNKAMSTLEVIDVATRKPLVRLEGHEKRVSSMAFSGDGTRILTTSEDGTARIWHASTSKQLRILSSGAGGLSGASWSPSDKRVVTVSDSAGVELWDPDRGVRIAELGRHFSFSHGVWFSPNGSLVATIPSPHILSDDYPVRIWNAENGASVSELKGHSGMIHVLAFSLDGQRVLTASEDQTARIWNVRSGVPLMTFKGVGRVVESGEFNRDGTRVLIQSRGDNFESSASLWNPNTGERITAFRVPNIFASTTQFTADGAHVVMLSESGFLETDSSLWDAYTGNQVAILRGSVSSDARRALHVEDKVAVIGNSKSLGPAAERLVLKGHSKRILVAHFSPDGSRAVTASADHTARIWDARNGDTLAILHGHRGNVNSALFSEDGRSLLTASEDGTARIWDAVSGTEKMVLKGHRGAVYSAAFSLDGSRAVSIGEDRTVRQWRVKDGALLSVATLEESKFEELSSKSAFDRFLAIAITPDGTRALIRGREASILLRTFPSTGLSLDQSKREVPRCLALAERQAAYLEPDPPAWCIEQGKWPYHTLRWKAWLAAKMAGKHPEYPIARQQTAPGADEAYQAGRFEEAERLQGALAETFANATATVPGGEPATATGVFAYLARYALFAKNYSKALSAADRAIGLQAEKILVGGLGPEGNAFMNKAHALMFTGQAKEALDLHRKFRGKKIDPEGDRANLWEPLGRPSGERRPTLWEDGVRADFALFRSLGMDHPQMPEIEKEL